MKDSNLKIIEIIINDDCNIYININNLKKDDIIEVIKGV